MFDALFRLAECSGSLRHSFSLLLLPLLLPLLLHLLLLMASIPYSDELEEELLLQGQPLLTVMEQEGARAALDEGFVRLALASLTPMPPDNIL